MKILHFADLHLGVETYGHLNPATGLSTRLEDILKALDSLVEYALGNKVDLVVFCGDAYKSREPTPTQQREFAIRINRLASRGIPVFMLAGNHDLPNTINRATAIEIFDALSLKNIYIANKPGIFAIPLKEGVIQIAALPWPKRSALLAKEELKDLNLEQLNAKIQDILSQIIRTLAAKLEPQLPALLAAHLWVHGARLGSESAMTIGNEHMLLPASVANTAFDYVALGHIHKSQVVHENPPVVYSGSLERLDFGDEKDNKGFYEIEINPLAPAGKKLLSYRFQTLPGRRFVTFPLNLKNDEADPTAASLKIIGDAKPDFFKEAIVRLQISLPAQLENQFRDSEVRAALKEAHYLVISREVRREARLRAGTMSVETITPIEALKTFLESKTPPPTPGQLKTLLEYGEKLL